MERFRTVSGGYSGDVTPDPISNSEVKLASANGTARETVWESRTPPDLSLEPRPTRSGFFFCPVITADHARLVDDDVGFVVGAG